MLTITRTSLVILAATAVLGVAAPAASAKPSVVGVAPNSAATVGSSYQGTYRPVNDRVALSPDRSDQIGTVGQVSGIHALPVATTTTVSSTSFDWTAAAVGAGSVLSAGLICAGALGLRSRRRMALGV